jgi:hypothetical protein
MAVDRGAVTEGGEWRDWKERWRWVAGKDFRQLRRHASPSYIHSFIPDNSYTTILLRADSVLPVLDVISNSLAVQ